MSANRIFYYLSIAIGIFCGLQGCTDHDDPSDNDDGDDYITRPYLDPLASYTNQDYALDIDFGVDDIPTGKLHYHVFAEDPFIYHDNVNTEMLNTDISPVHAGYTCSDGCDAVIVSLPKDIKEVYVVSMGSGGVHVLNGIVEGRNIRARGSEQAGLALMKTFTKVPAQTYNTITATNTQAYFNWDASGVPTVLYPTKDPISSQLWMDISYSLPEGLNIANNPVASSWVHPGLVTSVPIVATCNIDLTFVYEGAGFLNSMGYYVYPTDQPPTSIANVQKYVAFPNTSLPGSGGNLGAGSKLRLKYFDGTAYRDTFPAGVTIGWFVLGNGFTGSPNFQVSNGYWTVCSDPSLNPEPTPALQQHVVLLKDTANSNVLISFEDFRRDKGTDNDFNDVIFYMTANPLSAIQIANVPNLPQYVDTDGDGVPDQYDEFPNDPTLAHTVHYPGDLRINPNAYGSLCFEDLWPSAGDYDMNDQVVLWNVVNYTNAQGNAKYTTGSYKLSAVGAKYQSGFGFQMGISPGIVKSVSITDNNMSSGTFSIASNGTENKQQYANIILWDDAFSMFGMPPGLYINTVMSKVYTQPKTVNWTINYTSPQWPGNMGTPPYNAYIIVNSGAGQRGKEVHLSGQHPTSLADTSFFSKNNDLTNIAQNRYYVGANNMPFALNLNVPFQYPIETCNIKNAYLYFNNWMLTNGSQYSDWNTNTSSSYRNSGNIYTKTK